MSETYLALLRVSLASLLKFQTPYKLYTLTRVLDEGLLAWLSCKNKITKKEPNTNNKKIIVPLIKKGRGMKVDPPPEPYQATWP